MSHFDSEAELRDLVWKHYRSICVGFGYQPRWELNEPTLGVFQYNKLLAKFSSQSAAVAEARKWDHTTVRRLSNGEWLWDNWPKNELK